MAYSKELIQQIADALANVDSNIEYYYDKSKQTVMEVAAKDGVKLRLNPDYIKIEPMTKDILELMEDFALEQDAEDVQESLTKILKQRNKQTCISNFRRAIHDFPKSKKSWDNIERKWLKERAKEFLDDI